LPAQNLVGLAELFASLNPHGLEGEFVLFSGHIDESYNKQVFSLSCLLARGGEWIWIAFEWEKVIERWNRRLKAQGRRLLTRYHAADCSSLVGEFAGWSVDEQKELTADLVKAFRGINLHTLAFAIDMKEFHEVFPEAQKEARPSVTGLIYGMMTKFLVFTLGDEVCTTNPDSMITLVHDRCPYDGVMADAFREAVEDPTFKYKEAFATLAPMGWENCTPLQPTDFIAYENFKDALRILFPHRRRKSLQLLIDLGTFGGGVKFLDRKSLRKLKKYLTFQKLENASEPTEQQKFDDALGKVLSVSQEEFKRREAEWKKQRRAKIRAKKLAKTSPASHAGDDRG
jgi:hypothetical protein